MDIPQGDQAGSKTVCVRDTPVEHNSEDEQGLISCDSSPSLGALYLNPQESFQGLIQVLLEEHYR